MIDVRRGMVVDVDLEPVRGSETGKVRPAVVVTNDVYNRNVPVVQVVPLTEWTDKKAGIRTNVEVDVTATNGLAKRSLADCLQTRPVDRRHRIHRVRGLLDASTLALIDSALLVVFQLTR